MFLNLVQRTNAEQGYNTVKVWGDADIFRSLIFSVIALTSVRLYYTCHCGYFVTEPQNWGNKIGVSIQQPLNRLWGRQSRTHAREHENKELDYFLEHNLKTVHMRNRVSVTLRQDAAAWLASPTPTHPLGLTLKSFYTESVMHAEPKNIFKNVWVCSKLRAERKDSKRTAAVFITGILIWCSHVLVAFHTRESWRLQSR